MKYLILLTLTFILTLSGHSQDNLQELAHGIISLEMQHPVWQQVDTNRVQMFYRIDGQTNFIPVLNTTLGTAFFVIHNGASYIVTASHVVGNPADRGILHLVNTNGDRQDLELDTIHRLNPQSRWFFHSVADIAIHPYAYPRDQRFGNLDYPESFISTNELPLLTPVVALGFPLNLGTYGSRISPVVTACETSSWQTLIPGERPDLLFMLLDKALAQGYSGCPIFTRQKIVDVPGFHAGGGPMYLVGICHSELSDVAGGKHSTIVPISCLVDIFKQPDFLQYEATRTNK